MDDPSATPDPKVDPPPSDTPPPDSTEELDEEPAGDDEPEPEADQSAAPSPIAQAEYTRATQQNAAIRRELGLPKGATQAEVVAALQVLKAPPGPSDEEDEEVDPRVFEANERAFNAELRVASAVYGEDFTADALTLINDFRTSNDLNELITGLAAFRDNHPDAAAPARKAPAAAVATAEVDADEDLEGDIGLSEGEASRQRESAPARHTEGGAIGAIRGLFEQAGVASRPPRA